MLLYIHTQTTTYIYRTSKTNKQAQLKMLTAWHLSLIHTSPRLCGAMPQMFPPQNFSARALNMWKAKCENAGKRAAHELQLPFFLLKKPLNVEVLSSPRRKSHEHHQSPEFKGRGRHASLSKALPTEPAAGWLQGTVIVQVASRSVVSNSCLGSKSQSSQEECELRIVEADPKGVCAGDPACLNVQSVRCDYGFPPPLECLSYSGTQRDQDRPGLTRKSPESHARN